MQRFIRHFFTAEFLHYAAVGGTGALTDFLLFVLLHHVLEWPYAIAAFIAFVIAATLSFLGFKYIVFKTASGRVHLEYGKFVAVATVGLTLTEIILYIGIDLFTFTAWMVKIFALGAVLAWNFTANKFWTFTKKED